MRRSELGSAKQNTSSISQSYGRLLATFQLITTLASLKSSNIDRVLSTLLRAHYGATFDKFTYTLFPLPALAVNN